MDDAKRIVIVGGGITGLSAAYAAVARARELGRTVAVTVLEESPRFGGNLRTERADGFLLDAGPDSWVVTKPQATALARELGLEHALIGTNPATRRYYIAWGNRLHAVPEGLVLGVPTRVGPLVRTSLFSWAGKARMAFEPLVPARRFEGDADESIAEFAARRLGHEAAERLVAPLLGGISAGDASDISVRAAFPQLVTMEQSRGSLVLGMLAARRERTRGQRSIGAANGSAPRAAREGAGGSHDIARGGAFVSLRGGVGELVSALVDALRSRGVLLRPDAPVEAMTRAEGGAGWTLDVARGERLVADAVLLAIPAGAAARVLSAAADGELRAGLDSIAYGSTATVFLGYARRDVAHSLDGVGFVVPRAMGRPILAGTWVSSKWEDRAPEGSVLLRVFVGGPQGEPLAAEGDDALERVARSELLSLMGLDAEPSLVRVFRFPRASAQMRVGHLARMRSLHERLERVAPGVRIAGGGYDGVGIPDCIRQGQEAGRALVDRA
jgi:oxygen-dependent protoporphyrinogen oxidase